MDQTFKAEQDSDPKVMVDDFPILESKNKFRFGDFHVGSGDEDLSTTGGSTDEMFTMPQDMSPWMDEEELRAMRNQDVIDMFGSLPSPDPEMTEVVVAPSETTTLDMHNDTAKSETTKPEEPKIATDNESMDSLYEEPVEEIVKKPRKPKKEAKSLKVRRTEAIAQKMQEKVQKPARGRPTKEVAIETSNLVEFITTSIQNEFRQ